ncbi:sensor histidine kinase [Aestuariivirga sp.]|uniref:sensor histidine kinase n=1 Tax=Aestuariivirga sp. TaxID=2650926 RepID=UPI00391DB855
MPDRFKKPLRILYVDDDTALVRLAQRVLGRQGFDLVHARNGDEALDLLRKGKVHVVALDHYLPDGTGLELLERFRELDGMPAVVYVTGASELSIAVAALKAGAVDFVPKTVGDEFMVLLASALEQAVEKFRLQAEKELAEREMRRAKERAEVLLKEVNHRVANSLSLVAALVKLQAGAIADPAAQRALNQTQSKIHAIAMIHKRLYASDDVRLVPLHEYLTGLLDHLLQSSVDQWRGLRLKTQLEPMSLTTDRSVNLGVIAVEWITNACKYAYPAGEGEIRVLLRHLGGGRAQLSVEDDGIGRGDQTVTKGTGLGSRIVGAMAISMNGDVEYANLSPGTAAKLNFSVLEEERARGDSPRVIQ